ncbi:class I SAM-dependent methyltransferase [Heyndrickxia sp. FSL W8-0496]|uniref:methyltransferase domain-containing protein n=1 Tax=Heyndrickxia TaxID=2837504 RepID=UPI0007172DEF
MNYGDFAYIYDDLMRDVPYDQWLNFFQNKVKKYNISGKKVMDLACGTGELTVKLAEEDFEVTGVDLSEDMLMVAREKAEKLGIPIQLFQQNMCALEGLGTFDAVTIFCDSLNYLSTPEEVQETFKGVYTHLDDNGLFIFDVHSIYKVDQIFMNETFTYIDDEISYIWNSFEGDFPHSVEHELTFFVLNEKTDQYIRFDELHRQRTFPISEYSKWLEATGFDVLEVSADYSDNIPSDTSERIFFVCKKNKQEKKSDL